jgi:hypothetical protein
MQQLLDVQTKQKKSKDLKNVLHQERKIPVFLVHNSFSWT